MQRFCFALAALTLASNLLAQDIPLSKILVDKEGWREWLAIPQVSYLKADAQGFTVYTRKGEKYASLRLDFAAKTVSQKELNMYEYAAGGTTITTQLGVMYVSDRDLRGIRVIDKNKQQQFKTLSGAYTMQPLAVWPDEGHLIIRVDGDDCLWTCRIEADGKLGPGDRYYSLRTHGLDPMPVTAVTMDAGYLLYASTRVGVQVFDPTGRLSGVIPAPAKGPLTAVAIGGKDADTLYVACGDRIYARRIQGKAAYTLNKAK